MIDPTSLSALPDLSQLDERVDALLITPGADHSSFVDDIAPVMILVEGCRRRWLDRESEEPTDGFELSLGGISCRQVRIVPLADMDDDERRDADGEGYAWTVEYLEDERRPTFEELARAGWLSA